MEIAHDSGTQLIRLVGKSQRIEMAPQIEQIVIIQHTTIVRLSRIQCDFRRVFTLFLLEKKKDRK